MVFDHYTDLGIDIVKLPSRIMMSNAIETRALHSHIISECSGGFDIDWQRLAGGVGAVPLGCRL